MMKEYFMEAFLQIAIVLSLFNSDYRDISVYNHLNSFRDSINGELLVSPIINVHAEHGQNPDLGVYVHPKNVRVEEVLRSVHSLGNFGRNIGVSSDVNAFLVNDTTNGGLSTGDGSGTGASSRVAAGGDDGIPYLNPALVFGDEPSKEDVDLIDIFWPHDIDMEGMMYSPLWDTEMELRGGLEKDILNPVSRQQQAISSRASRDHPTDDEENDNDEINTPDIIERSELSIFGEQIASDDQNWDALMKSFSGDDRDSEGDVTNGETLSNESDLEVTRSLSRSPEWSSNTISDVCGNFAPPLSPFGGGNPFETGIGFLENLDYSSLMDPKFGIDFGLDTLYEEKADDGYCTISTHTDDSSTPRSSFSSSDINHEVIHSEQIILRDEIIKTETDPSSNASRVNTNVSIKIEDEPSYVESLAGSSTVNGPGTPFAWADSTHISHNHTYHVDLKPPLTEGETSQVSEQADFYHAENIRRTRNGDEAKLKELDIPFTCEQISDNSFEWFRDVVESFGFNDQQAEFMRHVRKKGRNKKAAQKCRKNMQDSKTAADRALEKTIGEISASNERYNELSARLMRAKERYASLRSQASGLVQKPLKRLKTNFNKSGSEKDRSAKKGGRSKD